MWRGAGGAGGSLRGREMDWTVVLSEACPIPTRMHLLTHRRATSGVSCLDCHARSAHGLRPHTTARRPPATKNRAGERVSIFAFVASSFISARPRMPRRTARSSRVDCGMHTRGAGGCSWQTQCCDVSACWVVMQMNKEGLLVEHAAELCDKNVAEDLGHVLGLQSLR